MRTAVRQLTVKMLHGPRSFCRRPAQSRAREMGAQVGPVAGSFLSSDWRNGRHGCEKGPLVPCRECVAAWERRVWRPLWWGVIPGRKNEGSPGPPTRRLPRRPRAPAPPWAVDNPAPAAPRVPVLGAADDGIGRAWVPRAHAPRRRGGGRGRPRRRRGPPRCGTHRHGCGSAHRRPTPKKQTAVASRSSPPPSEPHCPTGAGAAGATADAAGRRPRRRPPRKAPAGARAGRAAAAAGSGRRRRAGRPPHRAATAVDGRGGGRDSAASGRHPRRRRRRRHGARARVHRNGVPFPAPQTTRWDTRHHHTGAPASARHAPATAGGAVAHDARTTAGATGMACVGRVVGCPVLPCATAAVPVVAAAAAVAGTLCSHPSTPADGAERHAAEGATPRSRSRVHIPPA